MGANMAALASYESRYERELEEQEWDRYQWAQELQDEIGERDCTGEKCFECGELIDGDGYVDGYVGDYGISLQYYHTKCWKESNE